MTWPIVCCMNVPPAVIILLMGKTCISKSLVEMNNSVFSFSILLKYQLYLFINIGMGGYKFDVKAITHSCLCLLFVITFTLFLNVSHIRDCVILFKIESFRFTFLRFHKKNGSTKTKTPFRIAHYD